MMKVLKSMVCSLLMILATGILLSPVVNAQLVPKPTVTFSGFYNFDGTSLTFFAGTIVISSEWLDGSTHTDSLEDSIIGAEASVSGLTLTGSDAAGHHFTDGTLTITKGTDVFMTCDLINVVVEPTSFLPGTINPQLLTMNMQNLSFGTGLGSPFADEFASLIAPSNVPDQGAVQISMTDFFGGDIQTGVGSFGNVNGIVDGAPAVTTSPFDCFSINKVEVQDKAGTDKDKIKVSKAGFRLDLPNTVDLSTDTVQIRIDGQIYDFAPGSFVQKGDKPDYLFKSASGVKPKIEARLRFDKAQWGIKVSDGDAAFIDNSDGVDITLMIGSYLNTENVLLIPSGGSGEKLKFTRSTKVSCRHATSDSSDSGTPGPNKLSCLSTLTVQHISGALVTKTSTSGELMHPTTVFTDETTGDIGIFHTSCSECLQCGDVDASGNFTIMEIDGLPGDKMSQKCVVPDASCSDLTQ